MAISKTTTLLNAEMSTFQNDNKCNINNPDFVTCQCDAWSSNWWF